VDLPDIPIEVTGRGAHALGGGIHQAPHQLQAAWREDAWRGWDSFQAIKPYLNAPTPEVVNDASEEAGLA
jgi:hypothetical protein